MSNRKRTSVNVFLAMLVGAAVCMPAQSHHSFPAAYHMEQEQQIEGTIVQFLYRNPHSFVHVMVPDKAGKMQTWAVEWGSGAALNRSDVNANSLKPGDKVIVKGNPSRDPTSFRMRLQSIERPADGWKWTGTFS